MFNNNWVKYNAVNIPLKYRKLQAVITQAAFYVLNVDENRLRSW
jgi:hypothetical protein